MKVRTEHTVTKEMTIMTIREMLYCEKEITQKSIIQYMKDTLNASGISHYDFWNESSYQGYSNIDSSEEAAEKILNKYWSVK